MALKTSPSSEASLIDVPIVPERKSTLRAKEWILAIPFLGPALIFYVLFLIVPLLGTIALSFTEWSGFSFADIKFVALRNFQAMGRDAIFWQAFRHNVVFLLGVIVLSTSVALVLALALDQNLPFSNLFRGIYLLPTVLSLVVVGIVFSLALSPSLGLITPFLQAIGLGRFAGDWLGNPQKVLAILIVVEVWRSFGLYMFLFIARLVAIPQELHEAAFVDGANGLQDIWHITLPLLKSTTAMVVLLAAIDSLKIFATVYVMTKGGPNHASEVLSTWAYFQAFTANKVGYGNAILVMLLVITFILAYIQVTKFQPKDEY